MTRGEGFSLLGVRAAELLAGELGAGATAGGATVCDVVRCEVEAAALGALAGTLLTTGFGRSI
jgi:hypothetical protein